MFSFSCVRDAFNYVIKLIKNVKKVLDTFRIGGDSYLTIVLF